MYETIEIKGPLTWQVEVDDIRVEFCLVVLDIAIDDYDFCYYSGRIKQIWLHQVQYQMKLQALQDAPFC